MGGLHGSETQWRLFTGAAAVVALAVASPVMAQTRTFDVPAQAASSGIPSFAKQAGIQLLAGGEEVRGRRTNAVQGTYSVDEGLEILLRGTGLQAARPNEAGIIVIRLAEQAALPSDPQPTDAVADSESTEIVVTGSRIPGSQSASPVIVRTQEQMKNAGQNTLTEVLSDIPQNFGGGVNPGVGFGVPGSNSASGAATINLRGIGGDATLTLLNGHRLAYNGNSHSVDISTIPFGAIDRLEIVADGASALYGSDAIAGVANIILKRDFDGLETTARIGASTDGGNDQQQYSAVGGTTWASGGVIAAYEFNRNTPIRSSQRSYAEDRSPGTWLFPYLKNHNALLSGHQKLAQNLGFRFDALYNNRETDLEFVVSPTGDLLLGGGRRDAKNETFVVAPSLTLDFLNTWQASLSGMYGEDHNKFKQQQFSNGIPTFLTEFCHCNRAKSAELGLTGPLMTIPGGDVMLALGGGYRSSTFNQTNENIDVTQENYYGYGEIDVPILSSLQESSIGHRLNLTAALRYENYPDVDTVVSPKIGLIYSPSAGFDIKSSWGKAFRAPTLFQQFFRTNSQVTSAAARGGTGFPPNATALLLIGGNPDLQPERATTWSVTAAAYPSAWGGARVEASYFNIDYRDRIVAPVTFVAQALSNPIFQDLVTFNPTVAEVEAAIAGTTFFNSIGRPFDPAEVVAIIHNVNSNAARQSVKGIDVSAIYPIDLGGAGSLNLQAYASYIDSKQQFSSLQPFIDLAGSIFNPPHFRGRAGATWNRGGATASAFVNHIGSVEDVRFTPVETVGSMTTLDLSARYRVARRQSFLSGFEVFGSIKNVFNDKPSVIRQAFIFASPYDASNYSPVGRFVTIGVTKTW